MKPCPICDGGEMEAKDLVAKQIRKEGFLVRGEYASLEIDGNEVQAYVCGECGYLALFKQSRLMERK
ncbi:hypothetical protein [Pontibacillus sp. HMF3514]|uniref:hypothetical protein n=1 Tax=Pontibacillus sp. HMF3514 TaxID=2692425 RepID=UPI0013204C88|nr:hypothetical protein [Pontibacillus sp. HMF3514]QHE51710.1 hypothetical protein GS400_06505 [Pontibacillus sp. HMF3514]